MTTDRADGAQRTPFVRRFQDRVTLIECDGRPVVVAREFGAMLDYGAGGQGLPDLIAGKWSDEFIPDMDSILLKNGRLAEFKALCASLGLNLVDKRAPSLLLLTESGIQLVLARSEKPEGKEFRRWLVSEAIPGYDAARRAGVLPGSNAPRVEGPPNTPPPPRNPPPAAPASALPPLEPPRLLTRRGRPPLPTGPVRPLLNLLDRYRRAGVLDVAAYHALRALAEPLVELAAEPHAAGTPPPPRPPRAPPGPGAHIDGDHDPDAPGLVPLDWAARPDFINDRYCEVCPDVVEPFADMSRAEVCVVVTAAGPYLSDGAVRSLARWIGRMGIHKHPRWRSVLLTTRNSLERAKQ